MKKNCDFILVVLSTMFIFSTLSYAQEMLVGVNMENADAWKTCALNQGADNTVTYEFNYTAEKPMAGAGGCLHVTGTNTGTGDGKLTNFMFYQQVTLQGGVSYAFDLAYKDVRTNNYWFEAYAGPNEPAVGSDYGTAQGAIFLGGWKSNNWVPSECLTDEFDGTFLQDACIANGTNPFIFEGSGDLVVYVGFRMGIYDEGANGYTFEVFVDDVSLKGPGTPLYDHTFPGRLLVYPNPASGKITVANIESKNIQIVNLAGQEVIQYNVTSRNMDFNVSGLAKGLYLLKSDDSMVKLMIK
ncbi:MAG: T9SS type A sorting domain-containing protein [Bacteroidales bacterium]|nr:T9SS type A sorting domain-containing protein [Bacteroidales bacterium]